MNKIKTAKNKIKNKKSQVQMAETIGVVIIILILLVIGIAVYSSYSKSRNNKRINDIQDTNALELADTVLGIPELQCTDRKINCVDELKISAFRTILANPEQKFYYSQFLGNSNITIIQLIPNSTYLFPNQTIQVYSKAAENYSSKATISMPINLYNPFTKTKGLAVLQVEKYS